MRYNLQECWLILSYLFIGCHILSLQKAFREFVFLHGDFNHLCFHRSSVKYSEESGGPNSSPVCRPSFFRLNSALISHHPLNGTFWLLDLSHVPGRLWKMEKAHGHKGNLKKKHETQIIRHLRYVTQSYSLRLSLILHILVYNNTYNMYYTVYDKVCIFCDAIIA